MADIHIDCPSTLPKTMSSSPVLLSAPETISPSSTQRPSLKETLSCPPEKPRHFSPQIIVKSPQEPERRLSEPNLLNHVGERRSRDEVRIGAVGSMHQFSVIGQNGDTQRDKDPQHTGNRKKSALSAVALACNSYNVFLSVDKSLSRQFRSICH